MTQNDLIYLLRDCEVRRKSDENNIKKFLDAFFKLSSQEAEDFITNLEKDEVFLFHRMSIQRCISTETRSKIYQTKNIAFKVLLILIDELANGFISFRYSEDAQRRIREDQLRIASILQSYAGILYKDIVKPNFTPLVIAYAFGVDFADNQNNICNAMSSIIKTTSNYGSIEDVAVFWTTIMPDIGKRKLRQLYLDTTDKEKENAKRALILLGESHLLSVIENIEGDYVMGDKKVKVTLGDGNTFHGDFVIAQSIENSFNKAASANTSEELKDLLKELSAAVGKMSEQLSGDEAKRVARALDTLVDEATSEKPDRHWWQVSVDGLAKAAENIGKIGKPVLDIINRLMPILVSVSG